MKGITCKVTAHVAVLGLAWLTTACGDCVSLGWLPLVVTVTDARTGQSVLAGATIIAVSSTRRDSILVEQSFTGTSMSVGCCSGGSYTVIVRRPGYLEATRENINVESARCGQPKIERVDIQLTPSAIAMIDAREVTR